MEYLLHYVWQHRMNAQPLFTTDGRPVQVVDPGLHNLHAGPDFFNAKLKIDGVLWAGNVEIHLRASDWQRHGHHTDAAYNNVVLHVVQTADAEALTADGRALPTVCLTVPPDVQAHYEELRNEETYPPCYRIIPHLPTAMAQSWLSRLTVERLETKTARVQQLLDRTQGDWERAFFITLTRNFGFGTNAEPFEHWAWRVEPQAIGKHRDDAALVEAFFLGQAGLLDPALTPPERRDAHYARLVADYAFLQHKFSLQPLDPREWKFGRLRPQNFPHVRLSQLAALYHSGQTRFASLLEAPTSADLRALFRVSALPYWQQHYTFGQVSSASRKELQAASLDLILINTVAPLFFAYGRSTMHEALAERAFDLLESVAAEHNSIVRAWERAGISVRTAADSQALLQLRTHYCDRKDCLRCRFGAEYLKGPRAVRDGHPQPTASEPTERA